MDIDNSKGRGCARYSCYNFFSTTDEVGLSFTSVSNHENVQHQRGSPTFADDYKKARI